MNSLNLKLPLLALGLGLISAAAQAEIVQVYGSGQIGSTTDSISPFGNQCGFTEVRSELLTADLPVDGGGVIPAGTWVSRHIIFQNVPGAGTSFARAAWEFDGAVLGTISESSPLGLEASAGDYVVLSGNYAVMTSLVNWMGDPSDVVEVVCASVPDLDGDGVLNAVDDYADSDIRATVFVAGINSGLSNDIILVTPEGSALEGVFLADILKETLVEARAAAVAAYELEHGDHDHDAKDRAKDIYNAVLDLVKDELKVWEEADIISKEEREVIEDILKDSALYRVASETGTVSVLGIDTGIPNDLVLVAPDGSDLDGGVYLADIVSAILVDAQAAAEAKYEEEHGDHDHDAQHRTEHVHDDFVDFADEALKVWEEAHIVTKEERETIEDILKDLLD